MDCIVSYRVAGIRRVIPIRADSTIDAALLVHQLADGACSVSARRADVQTPAQTEPARLGYVGFELPDPRDESPTLADRAYWVVAVLLLLASGALIADIGPVRVWLLTVIDLLEAL